MANISVNGPRNTPSKEASEGMDEMRPEDTIEDYLDHLCAPLVGLVPYMERSRLRSEAGYHLERLMAGYVIEGIPPQEAVRLAIEKYGSSQDVGQQFLESWFEHQPQGVLARKIGLGNVRALIYFGAATALATALVQFKIYWPNPEPITFGLTLADIRRIVPEPLPLPDANPVSLLLLIVAIVAPIIAGACTGTTVPIRPARSVYLVQTVLILYTFVHGMQMLPMRDGLLLGLFMLCFWLPVGCLAANLAAAYTWRRRCRFRVGKR
jgi:hypothetical protein